MQALGLIETKGLLAAIEGADAMVKAAEVSILERAFVGGGLVTVTVSGDVGAVKASVEAGAAAICKLDENLLFSTHVIPRPHEDLSGIIETKTVIEKFEEREKHQCENKDPQDDNESQVQQGEALTKAQEPIEETVVKEEAVEDSKTTEEVKPEAELDIKTLNVEGLHKGNVDKMVATYGLDKTLEVLNKAKVVKLRNLAREYKEFGIGGRAISKADKSLLMTKFKMYYEKL